MYFSLVLVKFNIGHRKIMLDMVYLYTPWRIRYWLTQEKCLSKRIEWNGIGKICAQFTIGRTHACSWSLFEILICNLGASRLKNPKKWLRQLFLSHSNVWMPYSAAHQATKWYLPKSTQGSSYGGGVKFTFTQ